MKEQLLKERETVNVSIEQRTKLIASSELSIDVQKAFLKQDKARLKLIDQLLASDANTEPEDTSKAAQA